MLISLDTFATMVTDPHPALSKCLLPCLISIGQRIAHTIAHAKQINWKGRPFAMFTHRRQTKKTTRKNIQIGKLFSLSVFVPTALTQESESHNIPVKDSAAAAAELDNAIAMMMMMMIMHYI
jgi:hypothetical protein